MQAPIINRQAKTPNSADSYIAYIEDLARRNKGGGTLQAYDQSSNDPYVVPGGVINTGAQNQRELVQSNMQKLGGNARFEYDPVTGGYRDTVTGIVTTPKQVEDNAKSQIEVVNQNGDGKSGNTPILPTQNDTLPDMPGVAKQPPDINSGDLFDSMPTLQHHLDAHQNGGQVMGANTKQTQQPNPFGISPAISGLFKSESIASPYDSAALAKGYNVRPTGGMNNPMQTGSAPSGAGMMAYKAPDVASLAGISTSLDNRDKNIQGIESNIAGLDKKYQDLADPQNISHQSLSELKNLMLKQSGVQDQPATSSAQTAETDNLPLRSSLNQPVKGDLPAAGQGVIDLQGLFTPLEQGTQTAVKKIQDINPFKRIGEASAAVNGALDNGGKAIAQGADALKAKFGTAVSNASKAGSNAVAGVSRAIDNTKPTSGGGSSFSAATSKSTNVGKTSNTGGTSSSSYKAPSPGGQSVYSAPKVTMLPLSTYTAPKPQAPKATPAPAPKAQPKASPAPNPVATVVNIFKKLFGR